jgi:hypothetical protein
MVNGNWSVQKRAAYGVGWRGGHSTPERVLHGNFRLPCANLLKAGRLKKKSRHRCCSFYGSVLDGRRTPHQPWMAVCGGCCPNLLPGRRLGIPAQVPGPSLRFVFPSLDTRTRAPVPVGPGLSGFPLVSPNDGAGAVGPATPLRSGSLALRPTRASDEFFPLAADPPLPVPDPAGGDMGGGPRRVVSGVRVFAPPSASGEGVSR